MNLDELDGRIGEGWGGVAPNGSHVNVVLARRGSPTAAAAIAMLAHPRPGTRRCSSASARRSAVRAGLAADADDEQGDRHRRPPPDDHVGRRAARDRPGRARRGRRRPDRGDAATCSCSSRSGSIRAPTTRRPCASANREAVRKAIGVCVEGRDPEAAAALVARRDDAREPVLRRATDADHRRSRRGATATRSTRRSAPPGIPCRAARQEATLVIVHTDDGLDGLRASGDGLPDRALLERLLVGLDPLRTEVVREICETVDFHGGRPWTVEVAVWDLVGKALGEPLWQLLGGRCERLLAYASSGELVAPDERAERCVALATRACGRSSSASTTTTGARTSRSSSAVRDAVGDRLEIMVDANQGWRMPGDRAPRWDVATAAQCARALEPLGVYWLEEPLPHGRPRRATRRCARRTGAPARRRRDGARRRTRRATSSLRGGVDVIQTDVVLRRRARRLPADRRARRPPRPRLVAAHVVERARARREPARGARLLDLPVRRGAVDPPAWSAERRDWLLPDAARDRRRRHDRAAARARASASSPTSTRSSSGGSR